jgi:hypothetical protein
MAIFKNVEIHFVRLDPKRPNKKFKPENPTWELQMRTKDKAKKNEWIAADLGVKAVMDEDDNVLYYRVNLKKKSIKIDEKTKVETPAAPVDVVDGKGNPVDPNSIGSGSIANVRVFQYPFTFEGKKGIAAVLMAVQLVKHILYIPNPMEDFDTDMETETVIPEDSEESGSSIGADIPDNGKEF